MTRSAHNPEAAGSNPVPATMVMSQDIEKHPELRVQGVSVCGDW